MGDRTVSFSTRLRSQRRRLPLLVPTFVGIVVLGAVVVGSIPGSRQHRDPNTGTRHGAEAARGGVVTSTTRPDEGLPPLLPATATSPLRVLEIGDSLGIDLGDQLQSQLDANGLARTSMAAVGDSGLSNEAYFNWPAHLAGLLATDRPQVVVIFVGANDDQGIDVDGVASAPGTLAWVFDYAERVDDLLREATGAGARVIWVGMPPMENPDLNVAIQREDVIYERETERFPGALYMSSAPVLGNASGLYLATGDVSGQQVSLRTNDGVHLTPAGAGLLAHAVIDAIAAHWHLSVAGPPPLRSVTTT